MIKTDSNLISVVIVNWNGAEVLPECLKSVLELNHKNIEIIVVDNGSTDDSINIINQICGDKAKIVNLEKNVGFAAGINIGVENAKGEFIATLNNDMVVEPSWLDQPLELLLKDTSVGIVSCRQMDYYDRDKVNELYHYIRKELVFIPFGYDRKFRDNDLFSKKGYVISANGGSAILRAETVKSLGGYDVDFFGYMEEADFCLRAFLYGWRCMYAPDAIVYHMDGFTFKKNRAYKYYLCERNRIWFLYKNIPTVDILKRLLYMFFTELRVIGIFCFKIMRPFLYLKARRDAIYGLSRYKNIRKNNTALFNINKKEFYRLEKYKKLDTLH
ncbi:MAG: glycosyltransferase family 2 protein [Chitinispirillales bacterium]|nr:glycosyltransferase family 2 protein [Chitinispirillales bacterium]